MKHSFITPASHACSMVLRSVGLGLVIVALSNGVQAGTPPSAPEIDAGSLVSGLTLLAGGVLVVTNRIRRK